MNVCHFQNWTEELGLNSQGVRYCEVEKLSNPGLF